MEDVLTVISVGVLLLFAALGGATGVIDWLHTTQKEISGKY